MSFVERLFLLCPLLGVSFIGGFTVTLNAPLLNLFILISGSSSSNDYNEISNIQQHSYNSPIPPSSPTKRNRPHNNSDYTERQFSPVIWGVTPPLSPIKKIRSSSNSNNISCEVVQFISSRICRQIGPGENTEGVRLALGISLTEAQSIR